MCDLHRMHAIVLPFDYSAQNIHRLQSCSDIEEISKTLKGRTVSKSQLRALRVTRIICRHHTYSLAIPATRIKGPQQPLSKDITTSIVSACLLWLCIARWTFDELCGHSGRLIEAASGSWQTQFYWWRAPYSTYDLSMYVFVDKHCIMISKMQFYKDATTTMAACTVYEILLYQLNTVYSRNKQND